MSINEKDISALRSRIRDNPNFSDPEKDMLIDAITVAILRYEQKDKTIWNLFESADSLINV